MDTCAAPLRYCESWLVDHGRSRLLDAHAARMAASLRPYGVPRTDVLAALLALVDAVPDDGQWFPRLEWCGEHFHQRVRRLGDGAVRSTARLVTGGPDPRVQPRHKGPDFDTQDKLRAYAVQHGGDDALLVDAAGAVTESAYGSVLWWRDGDGDLVDTLMDAITPLADDGVIWVVTPKTGKPGHVQPAEIAESAPTAGLMQTSSANLGDWIASRLVQPRAKAISKQR